MADEIVVGDLTVWGVVYPVSFRFGAFRVRVAGDTVRADRWDELEDKIKKAVRKNRQKVSVPFVHPETGKRGVATGLHSTRGTPRIEWADGTVDHLDVGSPLRAETNEVELIERVTAAREAGRLLKEFLRENALAGHRTLAQHVRIAMEEAAKKEEEQ